MKVERESAPIMMPCLQTNAPMKVPPNRGSSAKAGWADPDATMRRMKNSRLTHRSYTRVKPGAMKLPQTRNPCNALRSWLTYLPHSPNGGIYARSSVGSFDGVVRLFHRAAYGARCGARSNRRVRRGNGRMGCTGCRE